MLARATLRLRSLSARAEDGYSVVEAVIAIALAVTAIIGPLYFIIVSIDQQNAVSSRTAAALQAETGLQQLVRDLREAMPQDAAENPLHVSVTNPTAATTAIAFNLPTPGASSTPRTITWTCPSIGATTVSTCTRQIGSGPAQSEVVGVRSATFTPKSATGSQMSIPATDPAYIDATLSVQVTSQLDNSQSRQALGVSVPITVHTGIDLRNFA